MTVNIPGYILTGHHLASLTCGLLYVVTRCPPTRCPPSISVVSKEDNVPLQRLQSLSQVKEHQWYLNQSITYTYSRHFTMSNYIPLSLGQTDVLKI